MVFLGSSGSEAMEAAIKVAERAAGPKRPKIVYAENSFHGKTKGVLSVTDGALYRGEFKLVDNTVRVPFGDIVAVENAFRSDPGIGVIVLETVQGDTLTVSVSDGSVKVNDATVLRPDVDASNGVVHVIDTVLLPAAS